MLITGNSAGLSIQTYDFADGTLASSFVPSGAINGRGLAINGTEIFYTESDSGGPSDSIHVCAYGTEGSGSSDTRTLPNPRPSTGIQDLAFQNGVLYALTGYGFASPQVFKLNPTTGATLGAPLPARTSLDPNGACHIAP